MAARGPEHGHLDAFAGREVVFCHNCSNEWYRDEHGLVCPRCNNDVIEIVTAENDPREIEEESGSEDGMHGLRNVDSDPEEADIEEHIHQTPGGFMFHRSVHNHSPHPGGGNMPAGRSPIDADDGDQILRRFMDMINGFSVGPPSPHPRTGYMYNGRVYGNNHDHDHDHDNGNGNGNGHGHDHGHDHDHGPGLAALFGGTPSGFQQTTFRTGPGGMTSVTIASGPIRFGPGASGPHGRPGADFQSVFGNILGDAGYPGMPPPGERGGPGGPPMPGGGFITGLHEILALLNPAGAAHGDAVYSQEALDHIITTLMEQNPQSNAAPPASEAALGRLERKKVDDQMLDGEGVVECTICIDEMKKGDEVAVLPCKHWFHEQCVVMWLREHNTCPICRTPIEKPAEGANRGGSGTGQGQSGRGGPGSGSGDGPPRQPGYEYVPINAELDFEEHDEGDGPGYGFGGGYSWLGGGNAQNNSGSRAMPSPPPGSERQMPPLSEMIRNLAGGAPGYGSTPEGVRTPNSRRPAASARRDSSSPPFRPVSLAEQSLRTRHRSPSPTNASRRGSGQQQQRRRSFLGGSFGGERDRDRDRERERRPDGGNAAAEGQEQERTGGSGGGGGPLSWLRDHLGGTGRERRRS